MENTKQRVLAYSKAKLIGTDTLSTVSGGKHDTARGTLKASAANQYSGDVITDAYLDCQ